MSIAEELRKGIRIENAVFNDPPGRNTLQELFDHGKLCRRAADHIDALEKALRELSRLSGKQELILLSLDIPPAPHWRD